jgi:RNA polymerase sigma-70 factor (ECF subfamily)
MPFTATNASRMTRRPPTRSPQDGIVAAGHHSSATTPSYNGMAGPGAGSGFGSGLGAAEIRPRDAVAEAAILRRMARGETAALNDLWDVWSRPLFAVAVRALGSAEDAEEVLQDALVRFWNKAPDYDFSQSQPFTWAVMILRGLIHDRLRARRRRPVLVSSSSSSITGGAIDFPSEFFPPGQRGDLEQALSLLTPDERQALDIAVFHPATHEEIATRLGQPLGTVKSRIRRALDKLRSALTEDSP